MDQTRDVAGVAKDPVSNRPLGRSPAREAVSALRRPDVEWRVRRTEHSEVLSLNGMLSDKELIVAAAVQAGVPVHVADTVIRAYTASITRSLATHRSVRVVRLGTFHVVPRRAGFSGRRVRFSPNERLRRAMAGREPTAAAAALAQRVCAARALRAKGHRSTTTALGPTAGDANVAGD